MQCFQKIKHFTGFFHRLFFRTRGRKHHNECRGISTGVRVCCCSGTSRWLFTINYFHFLGWKKHNGNKQINKTCIRTDKPPRAVDYLAWKERGGLLGTWRAWVCVWAKRKRVKTEVIRTVCLSVKHWEKMLGGSPRQIMLIIPRISTSLPLLAEWPWARPGAKICCEIHNKLALYRYQSHSKMEEARFHNTNNNLNLYVTWNLIISWNGPENVLLVHCCSLLSPRSSNQTKQ